MRIAVHAGVHFTDGARLIKSVRKEQKCLKAVGIVAPAPRSYRTELKRFLNHSKSSEDMRKLQRLRMNSIDDDAETLVLSSPSVFGREAQAIGAGHFYPSAVQNLVELKKLYPGSQIELFVGLKNPANFIHSAISKCRPRKAKKILTRMDPLVFCWSELVERLMEEVEVVRAHVWCHEDTPLIWSQILREILQIDYSVALKSEFDLVAELMLPEGYKRLLDYLQDKPTLTELQKKRVTSAFLEKYADVAKIEEDFSHYWPRPILEDINILYEEDLERLARLPTVNVITP